MRRWGNVILCVGIGLMAAGCPKGGSEYGQARKSENLQDLDTALQYYQKAYNADPRNAAYRIKLNQIRFEAGAFHVKQGQKLRESGDLQGAVAEFQRAAFGSAHSCGERNAPSATVRDGTAPSPVARDPSSSQSYNPAHLSARSSSEPDSCR